MAKMTQSEMRRAAVAAAVAAAAIEWRQAARLKGVFTLQSRVEESPAETQSDNSICVESLPMRTGQWENIYKLDREGIHLSNYRLHMELVVAAKTATRFRRDYFGIWAE